MSFRPGEDTARAMLSGAMRDAYTHQLDEHDLTELLVAVISEAIEVGRNLGGETIENSIDPPAGAHYVDGYIDGLTDATGGGGL